MTAPAPVPTRDECLDEAAPALARLFDAAYGEDGWTAPEPADEQQAS